MSAASAAISAANSRGPGSFLHHPVVSLTIGSDSISPNDDYRERYPLWRTLRDCYAGQLTVKQAGERYLRRPSNVKPSDYDSYISRAYFYNGTRRTHTGLLGSMMRKNPEFVLPANLKIDLNALSIDGMSAVEFTRRICSELLLVGRFGILTDIPADVPLGTIPTPYLSGYLAENIYFWRHSLVDGRRVVDRVILTEQESVNTEYGRTTRDVYRVLRLDPTGPNGALEYSQTIIRPSSTTTGPAEVQQRKILIQGRTLSRIPFEFVNVTHLLPESEDPPLLDLAMINLSHYDSTALLEHGRFYAGMPTYYIAGKGASNSDLGEGLGSTEPLSVGPSNVWMLEDGDKCGLLEFTGHGLSFLENAVDSKQLQMQSLGGKFIPAQQKSAALSTEAYGLMEAGDEATLLSVALTVERALERSFDHMSEMQNNAPSDLTSAELNKEFVRSELSAREITALRTLYESRTIPLDIMFYSLRQVGVIPMEYTLEDFKKLMTTPEQLYADPKTQPIPGGPVYNPADIDDPRNKPTPSPRVPSPE